MAGSTTMHVSQYGHHKLNGYKNAFNFIFQVFYVGVFLSIVGYCAGWFMALAVDLPYRDRIAIGCESTIQNTGSFIVNT